MPPLRYPKPYWKPILYSLILMLALIETGISQSGLNSNDALFRQYIEAGKAELKAKNGATARISFQKAWDNSAFTKEQQDTGQKLYYKAKNLDPYFSMLEEAEGHITAGDYKSAVNLLKRSEKHLYSSSIRFPEEELDNFFSNELNDKIDKAEQQRLKIVNEGYQKAEAALKSNPALALETLQQIAPQMEPQELAQFQVYRKIDQIKVDLNYESYLTQGQEAMEAKNYSVARDLFLKAWELTSSQEIYQLILDAENAICRADLEQSKREMELNNYEYALELLEKSAECATNEELEALQENAMSNLYDEYLVQGKRALEEENFQVAWSTLKKARRNKTTSEVETLIKKAESGIKYENYLQLGLEAEEKGEFQEAFIHYEEAYKALQRPGAKTRLEATQELLKQTNELIKKAEEAIKEQKWELARTHLQAGQRIYPKNETIAKLLLQIDELQKPLEEDSK